MPVPGDAEKVDCCLEHVRALAGVEEPVRRLADLLLQLEIPQIGLLLDLADRRGGQRFARFHVSLREAPAVLPGLVQQ